MWQLLTQSSPQVGALQVGEYRIAACLLPVQESPRSVPVQSKPYTFPAQSSPSPVQSQPSPALAKFSPVPSLVPVTTGWTVLSGPKPDPSPVWHPAVTCPHPTPALQNTTTGQNNINTLDRTTLILLTENHKYS